MLPNLKSVLLFLSLSLLVASCAPYQKAGSEASTQNDEMKNQATELFKKSDYTSAADIYEKLLEKEPDNKDYLFYYAESFRLSGNSGKAYAQYDKLIERDKNNLAAIEGKGLAYLQDADLINALAQFNIVITKDVSRWRTINAIGVVYSISGKDDEAMQYYDMAMELSKNNPSIINNVALSVAFSGDHEKGITLLKKAVSSMPNSDSRKKRLENNLALLYGLSGKMDEAEAILRKNLPERAVYNNLGFYAKLASDKKLAWSYLSKAISSSPVYYEKAENNMKLLEVTDTSGGETPSKPASAKPYSGETSSEKVKRGTHKLPLPTLRP